MLRALCLILLISGCSAAVSRLGVSGVKPKKLVLSPRWAKNLDPAHDTGNLPIALQSPLIHRGMVFVGDNNGYMKSYSLEDGRLIWRADESSGYHSQPLAHKNMIIYGNAFGRVFARDYRTGKLVYSVDLDAAVESEAVIYRGRLFIHTRNHKIFSLDVETGKILWAYKRSVPYLTTLQRVSKPLIHSNRLFVGFADGHLAAFSVEEGVLLWETRVVEGTKFVDVDSTPVIFSGKLVVTSLSDSVAILDVRTGMLERKVPYSASRAPYVNGKMLILGTADGQLVSMNSNFKVIQKSKVAKDSISNIVSWKNGYVVSTVDGYLLYVASDSLQVEERKFLGHKSSAVFGKIATGSDSIATLSSRNRLYVY